MGRVQRAGQDGEERGSVTFLPGLPAESSTLDARSGRGAVISVTLIRGRVRPSQLNYWEY